MKLLHIFSIGALIGLVVGLMIFFGITPTPVHVEPTSQYPILLYADPTPMPRDAAPSKPETVDFHIAKKPAEVHEDPAGAVFQPITFPSAWYVCTNEIKVYGGLKEDEAHYLYSLPEGTAVQVRELGQWDLSWAMIEPAHWVKFQQLCQTEIQ